MNNYVTTMDEYSFIINELNTMDKELTKMGGGIVGIGELKDNLIVNIQIGFNSKKLHEYMEIKRVIR